MLDNDNPIGKHRFQRNRYPSGEHRLDRVAIFFAALKLHLPFSLL
jgi:hypothetical protein